MKITGAAEAARRLRRVGDRAGHQQAVLAPLAARAAKEAASGVPVETGALQRSIRVLKVDGSSFVVGSSGVPYAGFVFHGTVNVEPSPPSVSAGLPHDAARAMARDLVKP